MQSFPTGWDIIRCHRGHALNSNTVATRHLLREGGIRIKPGSCALWLLPSKAGLRVPFAVPVDTGKSIEG